MHVFTDRKGNVQAAFAHLSDAIQFREANAGRHYQHHDEPGLTPTQLKAWIGGEVQSPAADE